MSTDIISLQSSEIKNKIEQLTIALVEANTIYEVVRRAEYLESNPPTWKNTLYAQHVRWAGYVGDAKAEATKLGYTYYCWNDRIYWAIDGETTSLTISDVK
jgi:hypothetical protein